MHLEKQMNHAYVVPYIFFQKVINSKDKINSTIQRFKINIFTSRFQVFCSDFKNGDVIARLFLNLIPVVTFQKS